MPADQLTDPDPDPDPDPALDGADTGTWQQVDVEFGTWPDAATVTARHLRPVLDQVSEGWWYIRKHPHWRIRYRRAACSASSTAGLPGAEVPEALSAVLDALVRAGTLAAWHPVIYEPEILAFGGPAAMDAAHDLFCHDSRTTLDLVRRHDPAEQGQTSGQRELSLLAISTMLRSAHLDPFEQGDVWARVARLRGRDTPRRPVRPGTDSAAHLLLTLDTSPTSALVSGGRLAPHAAWFAAFDNAGARLAQLARAGLLTRGLRAVLTHHVIFHWNRMAIAGPDQRTLAELAQEALLPSDADPPPRTVTDGVTSASTVLGTS